MTTPRILFSTLGACTVFLLTAYSNPDSSATVSAQTAAKVGNPITGEGFPSDGETVGGGTLIERGRSVLRSLRSRERLISLGRPADQRR